MNSLLRIGARVFAASLVPLPALAAVTTQPSFQVDYPHPTADKPQSKLWHAAGCWWALLPTGVGPSLWQRTATGWREHPAIRHALQGLPGRADVWADDGEVTAASAADRTIAVFRLTAGSRPDSAWEALRLARWTVPTAEPIETVTIARDGAGRWWIAAAVAPPPSGSGAHGAGPEPKKRRSAGGAPRTVWVWSSADRVAWQALPPLETGIGGDDICAITPTHDGIGVAWSDQLRDRVMFRRHLNAQATTTWEPAEVVATGGRTADDHLHAALTDDGTLWLATKNSVDQLGAPQLVLRVRSRAGEWRNLPYAPRLETSEPSRPTIVAVAGSETCLLGHTVYARTDPFRGRIEFVRLSSAADPLGTPATTVIASDPALRARINDVTTPKAPFPASAPWIVLASDAEGRVYEADLRSLGAPPVTAPR